MIFFLINILAPGNSVRQTANIKTTVIKSILKSLWEAYRYTTVWTNLVIILLLLIMTPFIWKVVSNSKCRFPYPGLFLIVTFGVFAAHLTPTIYAQSFLGPRRMTNIVYFSYYIFLFSNYLYILGWIHRILKDAGIPFSETMKRLKQSKGLVLIASYLACVLVFISVFFMLSLKSTSSFSALQSLRN